MANRNSDAIGDRFIVLQLTPSPVIVCRMRDWLVLMAHLIVTTIRTVTPGGARAVIAESLLLKHQLLILNRSRKKAPKLRALDRILMAVFRQAPASPRPQGTVTGTDCRNPRDQAKPESVVGAFIIGPTDRNRTT